MSRDLYYIPEEELESTIVRLFIKKNLGIIEIIIGFVLAFMFVCTDISRCDIPWWLLVTGIILSAIGLLTLRKVYNFCYKYDLTV